MPLPTPFAAEDPAQKNSSLNPKQAAFMKRFAEEVKRRDCYDWVLDGAVLYCAREGKDGGLRDVPIQFSFYKGLERLGYIALAERPGAFGTESSGTVLEITVTALALSQAETVAMPPRDDSGMANTAIIWGPIRTLLPEFSFTDMKEIVGLAGMDVMKLAHLQQAGRRMITKGHLLTGIDAVLRDMAEDETGRFLRIVTEEALRRRPDLEETLRDYLTRLGWTLHDESLVPLELLDVSELPQLPVQARADLVKAATRLRDGDLTGAVSAACGSVDAVTGEIYGERGLGDPGRASFQERINTCLRELAVFEDLRSDLVRLGWPANDAKHFEKNLKGSLNQAAFVMQTLRSKMGDVHGSKPFLKPLVFDSLKWAALITRMLNQT